jgi:quercetin dioxygenase-like cupin family protein
MATTTARFVDPDQGEQLEVLGTAMQLVATVENTAGTYEVAVVAAGQGGDLIPHRHPWEEFYFVLEGQLEVQVGARHHHAGPGSFVTMPPRALHAYRVLSDGARFLHVSFGRGASAAFRDFAAEVSSSPGLDELPVIMDINRRHGIDLVIPPELLEAAQAMTAAR